MNQFYYVVYNTFTRLFVEEVTGKVRKWSWKGEAEDVRDWLNKRKGKEHWVVLGREMGEGW